MNNSELIKYPKEFILLLKFGSFCIGISSVSFLVYYILSTIYLIPDSVENLLEIPYWGITYVGFSAILGALLLGNFLGMKYGHFEGWLLLDVGIFCLLLTVGDILWYHDFFALVALLLSALGIYFIVNPSPKKAIGLLILTFASSFSVVLSGTRYFHIKIRSNFIWKEKWLYYIYLKFSDHCSSAFYLL